MISLSPTFLKKFLPSLRILVSEILKILVQSFALNLTGNFIFDIYEITYVYTFYTYDDYFYSVVLDDCLERFPELLILFNNKFINVDFPELYFPVIKIGDEI